MNNLVGIGCMLGLFPFLYTSGIELIYKYNLQSYFSHSYLCPEFRFGVSVFLMGGLMYKFFT